METRGNDLSWIELDENAFVGNVRVLKEIVGSSTELWAVVKADAYGHGAARIARLALLYGASGLAVSSLEEAISLRREGISSPILIMSVLPTPDAVIRAVQENLIATVFDSAVASIYENALAAVESDVMTLRVHLKMDTGMGRLGTRCDRALEFFRHVESLRHLSVGGMFTHFSRADETEMDDHTSKQLVEFEKVLKLARERSRLSPRIVHAANSAAVLSRRDSDYDAVRVGLAMYGISPFGHRRDLPEGFRPVLEWKTRIAQVKTVPRGNPIGYGGTYETRGDPERLAVIPVGYADGIRRGPIPWKKVLVRGVYAPIVGRVCMEKTTIDVSRVPESENLSPGEEVVLIGKQGNLSVWTDEIALDVGTSPYEILCAISQRIPRLWKRSPKISNDSI